MKAVIVAGGEAHPDDAAVLAGADLVVAADGGALWAEAMGVRPHVIVGDLDSVPADAVARLEAAGSIVERHPADKDASDAELAVEHAFAAGADEIVIIGALGGERLDHELANLLLLAEPAWTGRRMRVVRGGTTVRAAVPEEPLDLVGTVGDLVTLLPIGGEAPRVTSRGLRYPLRRGPLAVGRSRGLSNEIVSLPASVQAHDGALLVVETRKRGT